MKKIAMKNNKINTIQRYFVSLYWVLNQLFESQRTKLEYGIGYNLYLYQKKTEYRIKNLFVSLKKILEIKNMQNIVDYLKRKKIVLEKNVLKNITCVAYKKKKYIRMLTERVLSYYFSTLLSQINSSDLNFEILEYELITELYEQIYEYQGLIDKLIIKKYGVVILQENFYKEKPITPRLKKKRDGKVKKKQKN